MEKRFNVTFEELTAEKQREIISSTDEEKILWKGVTSVDLQTRLVTLKNPNTTSEMLEKMLQEARDDEDKLVEAIFKDERLIQTEELITRLRDSHNSEIRQRAAEGIQDASILDEMMKNELKNGKNEYVILSIFSNKNYIRDKKEDIIEAYKQLYGIDEREIFIKSINDDSILDEFLNIEINDNGKYITYIDVDMIVQILNHTEWIPKRNLIQELIKKVSKSERISIIEKLTKTDVIEMMIEEEANSKEVLDMYK